MSDPVRVFKTPFGDVPLLGDASAPGERLRVQLTLEALPRRTSG
jgi:hypothetical protein